MITLDFDAIGTDCESFEACVLEGAVVGEELSCVDVLLCEELVALDRGEARQCSHEQNLTAFFHQMMVLPVIREAAIEVLEAPRVEKIKAQFQISAEENAVCEANSGALWPECSALSGDRNTRTIIALFLAAEDH